MPLKVIGAGFARTGTLSLKAALDELGVGPTYHMNEVFRNRPHLQEWLAYADTGTADWDTLFGNYESAVDFPAACAWKELYHTYPDAKVVLTVRDPDSWWRSTNTVIFPTRTMFPAWFKRVVPFTQGWLDMTDKLVWTGIFNGTFEDQSYATDIFNEHIETVRAYCDPERLLVFNVAEGWKPLCEFLDLPIPAGPFPHVNDSKSLRRQFAIIRWGTRAIPLVIAATAALTLKRRLAYRI